jgi:hypothetical protein
MSDEQSLPEVVYHYTSMDTLLKIVATGHIWATNINYLNDVLERRHCLARVKARLRSVEGKHIFGSTAVRLKVEQNQLVGRVL